MKKILLFIILSFVCLFSVVACGDDNEKTGDENTPVVELSKELRDARSYLIQLYGDGSETATAADYYCVSQVPSGDKKLPITWSVNTEKVTVSVVPEGEENAGMTLVDVTIGAEAIQYVLSAKIVGSDNSELKMEFNRVVPAAKATTIAEFIAAKDEESFAALTGVITAVNKVGASGAFILTDETGSIFCYDGLDVALGDKVTVIGQLSLYNDVFPQLAKPALAATISKDNDVKVASGTPLAITASEIKADLSGNLTEKYAGKYLEITGYVMKNSQGYINLKATLGDTTACVNLYKNDSIALTEDLINQQVKIYGFMRGSSSSYITIQVQGFEVVKEDLTDEQFVDRALNSITLPEEFKIAGSAELAASLGDVTFTWEILGEATSSLVISEGKLVATLGEEEVTRTVKLTATLGETTKTKEFTVTVAKKTGVEEELPTIKSILDEAASLGDGEKLEGTRKTVGTVKEIVDAYSTQYKNITFILEDATGTISVFRAKGNCAPSLKVGDIVYVEGNVTKFKTKIEFEYATLTTGNESEENPNEKVELSTVAEVLEAAKNLANDEVLTTQYKVTGKVSNFKENFSYGGGSYYTFDLTDETGKIYVYSPVGTILETLKNGEIVFVKGTVKNYKGTIEFDGATVSYADDFDKSNVEKLTDEEKTPVIPSEVTGTYEFISLPMAIAIARDGGEDFTSTDTYYITGWISNVSNASFGELTITDGNVTIYAYGISNYTSGNGYPLLGDVVVLEAVLGTKGADVELKNTTKLVEWYDVKVVENDYTAATIEEARNAEAGSKLIVEGVVAGFTYKNAKTATGKYVADGLYLVNGTDSIYVFGVDLCSVVEIGNTIKIAGVKEYFVQSSEVSLAEKYGFTGACQLSSVELIENKGGNTDVLANSFEKTTIKNLMENNYDANITTQIYEVNALIRKVPGDGFVNYYINDLDGKTGTYTYTKCNGNDFAWIDSYLNANGEYLCTLLVTVCNAKATASGCNWRMIPLKLLAPFTFDKANTAEFVLEYLVLTEFDEVYYANPETELITTHASELLGYEGVTVSYSSDNESVVKFTDASDKKVLNVLALGEANVTITVNYNGTTATKTIKVVREGEPTFEALTVKEAIDTPKGEEITVMGIVTGGVANQKTGFYLIDETGAIAVKMLDADQLAKVAQGNKVVIKGKREQYKQTDTLPGQTSIVDAEVVHNYFGEHEYSTTTFQETTLEEIASVPATEDRTAQVYIIEAATKFSSDGRSVIIENGGKSLALYASGVGQYKWLTDLGLDKTVRMEVALCNWNNKTTYKAYVLAVYLEDGTKVVNPNNFAS